MRTRALHRRVLAALLLVSFPACYSYVPLEDGTVKRGDEVRVSVSEGTPDPVTATDSPSGEEGTVLQGVVVTSDRDSLVLWSRPLLRGSSFVEEAVRDTVSLSTAEIAAVERSELDAVKTGGLVLGSLGVIAGFAVLVSNAEGGGGGDFGGGDGGNLTISVPLP